MGGPLRRRSLLTASVGLLALTVSPAVAASGPSGRPDTPSKSRASDQQFAPVDRAGPPLRAPAAALAQSLHCSGSLAQAGRAPILLAPGTTLTPEVNFSWNYARTFDAANQPYCTVTLPDNAMSDIQVAGEYMVHAIRAMHRISGRKVDVVGFSQGGMVGRWALRFWPDIRPMVDDLIGLDPSNHGTLDAHAVCAAGCAPAFFQQRTGSRFLGALNSIQETFSGISYTQIYTVTDEVVFPNIGPRASSSLNTGDGQITNIAVQGICPVHVADHLTMGTVDPVGYALVRDALAHPGPAEPDRIDRGVCAQVLMPGVDPVTFPTNFASLAATAAEQVALYPHVSREPPLKPYVFADPPAGRAETASRGSPGHQGSA